MRKLFNKIFPGLLSSRFNPETFVVSGLVYHQDTNELMTGIVEEFYEDGQLRERGNFIDGKEDGLWEPFDEDGNLTETSTFENGELVEENNNP